MWLKPLKWLQSKQHYVSGHEVLARLCTSLTDGATRYRLVRFKFSRDIKISYHNIIAIATPCFYGTQRVQ